MIWRRFFWALIVIPAGSLSALQWATAELPPVRVFRVQDYGAIGKGTTLDTAAIQRAVDACSAAGGGVVYFSPGVYLSGTVLLKDNVRLFLETNAVLRGSPRSRDYPPVARKNVRGNAAFSGGFLLYADGVRNASIEGCGTIDGQGPEFWFKEMLSPLVKKPMPDRPRALVCIVGGASLLFRDVTLCNSPCFTLWLIGCDDVKIDRIAIRNPHDGPNTDGIDIDCCRRVCVANCSIDGGDDAIALKSDSGTLLKDKPCEDITVSNCVLCSVPACGVRIGYEGDAPIRNCAFSNLTIYDTNIGIDIVSVLPGGSDCAILKGTRVENIALDNIVMRNVNRAIFFWMGNEKGGPTQVSLKNISVSNVMAQSRFGSYVGGYPLKRAENVTLSNIRLILTGNMPEQAAPSGAGIWGGSVNPYALYGSWLDGLRLNNLSVDFREASGAWRNAVFCEEARDAKISGLHTQGFAALPTRAVIGLKRATAAIRDCDAEPQTATFLHAVEGSRAFVSGCDLTQAKAPFATDKNSAASESANRRP